MVQLTAPRSRFLASYYINVPQETGWLALKRRLALLAHFTHDHKRGGAAFCPPQAQIGRHQQETPATRQKNASLHGWFSAVSFLSVFSLFLELYLKLRGTILALSLSFLVTCRMLGMATVRQCSTAGSHVDRHHRILGPRPDLTRDSHAQIQPRSAVGNHFLRTTHHYSYDSLSAQPDPKLETTLLSPPLARCKHVSSHVIDVQIFCSPCHTPPPSTRTVGLLSFPRASQFKQLNQAVGKESGKAVGRESLLLLPPVSQ